MEVSDLRRFLPEVRWQEVRWQEVERLRVASATGKNNLRSK